MDIKASML